MQFAANILIVLAAYVAADALGGLYHLMTDLGYNIPSQIRFFRQHHERPLTMTFDLEPAVAAAPMLIAAWFVWPVFFVSLAVFLTLSQIPHYYAHHTGRVPKLVKLMQRCGLFITERYHNAHHSGNFNRNFCVLAGWNDWWINRLAARLCP